MRGAAAFLVLIVTSLAGVASVEAVGRRVLTLRAAERAIDLAWQAELAGDANGARQELTRLAKTSTLADESAAVDRLNAWLRSIDAREAAFKADGRSARGYREAHATLKDFGLKRSTLLFERAGKDLPELVAATASVSVVLAVGTLNGDVDRNLVVKDLGAVLSKHQLKVKKDKARYEARADVEASDVEKLARGSKVTANVAIVLRDLHRAGGTKGIASIAKHRTESRTRLEEARRMAIRRALDEAGEALVFQIRAHLLEEAVRERAQL